MADWQKNWTKLPIRKTVKEQADKQAAEENRATANYVETLILKDIAAKAKKKPKQ